MTTQQCIDWSDVEAAARQLAGNWLDFDCFAWQRGYDLVDADQWAILYTSDRDSGLLAQSNHAEITKLLAPFTEGDDPDVVAESHSHWAVGHIDGFSIRVFGKDGGNTEAFEEFCRIKAKLDDYPILNESDYSEREYEATLHNYRSEMWATKKELPEGWECAVYRWFGDNGHDRFIENPDDQGGWAPKGQITEALRELGLLPAVVVVGGK
jgi:hypothetical protein